jgi:integrase
MGEVYVSDNLIAHAFVVSRCYDIGTLLPHFDLTPQCISGGMRHPRTVFPVARCALHESIFVYLGMLSQRRRSPHTLRPGVNQRLVQRMVTERAHAAAERLQRDAEHEPDLARVGEMLELARRLLTATPHTLRHSLARRMIERGADLGEVQRVLGHTSIATTGRYLTPSEDDLREAIGRAGV